MEDINLQAEIDKEKIAKVLTDLFPELVVFHYSFGSRKPKKLDFDNPLHIFFHTVKRYSYEQFDFELRVYRTSSACETERALFIAQKISLEFSVHALVRSSGFLFHRQHVEQTLSNVLFQDNKAFIVDDAIKIQQEFFLPTLLFNSKADFIKEEKQIPNNRFQIPKHN